jgi:hypothetical protein
LFEGLTSRVVAACALCVLLVPWSARAQVARSGVALVRSDSNDRLLRDATTRLRAELHAAGFEVIDVDRAPGDEREEVEGVHGAGSFATVALNRARSGAFADVWVSDHVTGKTVVRRLEVGDASNAATVLAIRALELLRASLLEVAAPPPDNPPAREPPRDVLRWVEPTIEERPTRDLFAGTSLGVSALGLLGTSGLGLAAGPSVRVQQGLWKPWFARLVLAGPLVGPEPQRAEGSALVRQEYGAVDLGVATRTRPFGALAWAGLGVYHLHTVGSASRPYRATSDDVFALLTHAGAGGFLRLGNRAALTAELSMILLTPHPVVVIAGKDAGTAGAPSICFALGALIGL